MARRVETVVVPKREGDRDSGKIFVITEWPAAHAEKWALRMFLALKNSGQTIPDNIQGIGMVGVAILGFNVFLSGAVKPEDLEPLLDDMMTCVAMVRDPRAVDKATGLPVSTPIVSDDDIEEVQTRMWLRSEVLRVHTGFSASEALSRLLSAIQQPEATGETT